MGRPVVPEVYISNAGTFASTAGTRVGGRRSSRNNEGASTSMTMISIGRPTAFTRAEIASACSASVKTSRVSECSSTYSSCEACETRLSGTETNPPYIVPRNTAAVWYPLAQ